MKTNLPQTLAAAACALLLSGAAHAAADPLRHAVISASYNGADAGMLGLDHGFDAVAGSNVSHLDPLDSGVEFLTADALFGIDVTPDGKLIVMNNMDVPAGAYAMRFDFGASLAAPIATFRLIDAGGTAGAPVLTLIDSHTIGIDLTGVSWNGGEYASLTTQLGFAQPVPEPSAGWMFVIGLGLAGMLRRRRRRD